MALSHIGARGILSATQSAGRRCCSERVSQGTGLTHVCVCGRACHLPTVSVHRDVIYQPLSMSTPGRACLSFLTPSSVTLVCQTYRFRRFLRPVNCPSPASVTAVP